MISRNGASLVYDLNATEKRGEVLFLLPCLCSDIEHGLKKE
jgi:hypothetical protein